MELETAYYFPAYDRIPTRTNRPLFNGIVHGIQRFIGLSLRPFCQHEKLIFAAIGFIILNLITVNVFAYLGYLVLREFIEDTPATLAVLILLFHRFTISYITTYHTALLEILSPVVIIFLFMKLYKDPRLSRVALYSLIVGVLMLGKQNYSTYIALLGLGLFNRKFFTVFISVVVQFIPLALWILYLKSTGLPYYNHEAAAYGQGVWLYQEYIYLPVFEMISRMLSGIFMYGKILLRFYGIWLLLALAAVMLRPKPALFKGTWLTVSLLLLIFFNFLQVFAAKRYIPYMTADISIVVLGLACYTIQKCKYLFLVLKSKYWLLFILVVWLGYNLLQIIHLPWIHPYLQLNNCSLGLPLA
ncbi:MAG: hypothetical protein P9M14_05440 [Candidatus Alcyoniella australis]|nr:hypothetical protein [Candidatus Alcyoniella australis]